MKKIKAKYICSLFTVLILEMSALSVAFAANPASSPSENAAPAQTETEADVQDTAADEARGRAITEKKPIRKNDLQTETEDGTRQSGRLSKDTLRKAAAGFFAGLFVAFSAFVLWSLYHRKRKKISAGIVHPQNQDNPKTPFRQEIQALSAAPVKDSCVPAEQAPLESIGKVHHVGNRRNQQDTLGTVRAGSGHLAVVSDGMGGLSNGERVSQQAVKGMLEAVKQVSYPSGENPLFEMLCQANKQVLNMLGPGQLYKSGATLVAVLTDKSGFHWAAVGDSRIYFYCAHHLIQLNSEHIYKRQLLVEAVNQNISFSRVRTDPQRERLISFLGMGDLQWIDGSLNPVKAEKGDKLLLMSDGIFNTISEAEIIQILESAKNASEAAANMEQRVLAAKNPRQDNFTCMILDF